MMAVMDEPCCSFTLLVHAALLDATSWDDVVARAPHGVRTLAIDLPDTDHDAPGTTIDSLEGAQYE